MLEREGEIGNQNKEHSRETGIYNEEWTQPSRYRSTDRTECKRGKNTKRKRQGNVKTNTDIKIRKG